MIMKNLYKVYQVARENLAIGRWCELYDSWKTVWRFSVLFHIGQRLKAAI